MLMPLLPPVTRRGRPWVMDLWEVLSGILFLARTGCQWRMLTKDFPQRSFVQRCFYSWHSDGAHAHSRH